MWLCYHLACVVDEGTEFLPQHKQRAGSIGGYTLVGEQLCLSPDTVAFHVRNAQRKRDTQIGLREYHEWLTQRERKWWVYHAVCVERIGLTLLEYVGRVEGERLVLTNGSGTTLSLTQGEVDTLVEEAQRQLNTPRYEQDYKAWLAVYNRRDEKVKTRPLLYRLEPSDSPAAQAFDERRAAKGLRKGLTKAGRKRKEAK